MGEPRQRSVRAPTGWLKPGQNSGPLDLLGGSAAGGQLLTTCADGAARCWDAASGRRRRTYRGGSRFLVNATTSVDGALIVGGGGDGVLRFWATDSGQPVWAVPAHESHLISVRVDGDSIVTRGYAGDILRWTLPLGASTDGVWHQ